MATNHSERGIVEQIGKLIYPRLLPYQRRRELKTLLAAILFGLLTATMLAALMIRRNLGK